MRPERAVDGESDAPHGHCEHEPHRSLARRDIKHPGRGHQKGVERLCLLLLDQAGRGQEHSGNDHSHHSEQGQQPRLDRNRPGIADGCHLDVDRRRAAGHLADQVGRRHRQDDAIGRQALAADEQLEVRPFTCPHCVVEPGLKHKTRVQVVRLHHFLQLAGRLHKRHVDALQFADGLRDLGRSFVRHAETRHRIQETSEDHPDQERGHQRHDDDEQERRRTRPYGEVLAHHPPRAHRIHSDSTFLFRMKNPVAKRATHHASNMPRSGRTSRHPSPYVATPTIVCTRP